MSARRVAAGAALVLGVLTLAWIVVVLVRHWPVSGAPPLLILLAGATAWWGVRRRGHRRAAAFVLAAVLAVAAIVAFVHGGLAAETALALAGGVAAVVLARRAFTVHVPLPVAPPPLHPVLFVNPRSGDGRAERTGLVGAARERGLEVVVLGPGDDLETLVAAALARGADGLAMAGGDGSQAIVARIAAEHGLPYACIPSGTRNHFALDLGVDREDDIGALDAFGPGAGEHVVDLAEVNGRTFVNNASLGVYAEAVQRAGYRAAKLRTLLDTVPDVVGPDGHALDLEWTGRRGQVHRTAAVILVSNNRYRLGKVIGSGTRPRIDDGLLGIAVAGGGAGGDRRLRLRRRPWSEWSAPEFEVRSSAPVHAGIDGETVELQPPLIFRIRPGVLRARIAPQHPGASPSALAPTGVREGVAGLVRLAAGREVSSSRPGSSATG